MRFALLWLTACSFRPGSIASDEPSPDAAPAPPDALAGWNAPTVVTLPGAVGTEDDPSLTADLLELYVNTTAASESDIYVSVRGSAEQAWPMPVRVALVSQTAFGETTPEVSYDGLTMIVASNRTGTAGGNDLWLSTRNTRTEPWGDPQRIADLASPANEAAGNMSPDGLAIVFSSFRNNASPDLFYAERASREAAWTVTELVALNTAGHEGSPFLSADKRTIYFDSDREGAGDLYFSHRASTADPFPAPMRIPDVSSPEGESDPWVSLDERRIVFFSNRGGQGQLWEATRL